jgi:hypothetical protein
MSAPVRHFECDSSAAANAQDAEGIAAALLLKEVEAFLREGQPRHAIAHICAVTGIQRDQAAEFIAHLQNEVFQQQA